MIYDSRKHVKSPVELRPETIDSKKYGHFKSWVMLEGDEKVRWWEFESLQGRDAFAIMVENTFGGKGNA